MSDKIQLVIVDDHPLFREGVINTLRAEPDLEVVGQGTTAEDAIRRHGGEAELARRGFEQLSDADRAAILAFLRSI